MGKKLVKTALIIFFLVGTIQPLYSLSKILLYGGLFDLGFYRQAGQLFLSGKSIYSLGNMGYPPTSLFIFIPVAFLPVFSGQIIWSIFSFSCLLVSFIFSVKSLNLKLSKNDILLLSPLTLMAFPVKWTFGLGQINNFILLLLVLAFFFFKKGKERMSGVILGLAISFKITPVYLLLFFLTQRKFKVILAAVLTGITAFAISGFTFGFGLIKEYFFLVVPRFIGPSGKYTYYNQALSGFIARLVNGANYVTILTTAISLLLFLISVYRLLKQRNSASLSYSLIISLSLIINSYLSWQHHFVWLLFPFLTAFSYVKNRKSLVLKVLLIISYLLVATNIKQPNLLSSGLFGKILLSHVFLGNLLLWGILIFLINDKRRERHRN